MDSKEITSLKEEYSELKEFCEQNNQLSFAMYIDNTYKKSLLLSAASFLEASITKSIHDYVHTKSRQTAELVAFVDNKAIKRQYHTFFNWEGNNANQFFGLFGEDFKLRARREIETRGLTEAEAAFMAVGRERNRLVHQNYIEVQINDTFEEIWEKYEQACKFAELVAGLLGVRQA